MSPAKIICEDNTPAVYELNEEERQAILKLTKQLTGPGDRLIDDSDWLSLAREKSSLLPQKIVSILRKFRSDPGVEGHLLLRNIPVVGDTPLPDTPCVPNSVEREATIAASAISMIQLSLSEIISYRVEKGGALVHNVVPLPGSETEQSYAGSVLLEMHTERTYYEHYPDYITLLCVREDVTGKCKFCVSSIRNALPLLSADAIRVLSEPRFTSRSPLLFMPVTNVRSHPVLTGDMDDPNLSVDFADTIALDAIAESALEELKEAFMKTMVYYSFRVGDMAIVDNRVAVHGRTAFNPKYDGKDRWLTRVYGHLDNRRTRVNRKNNGPVLN